MKYLKLIIKPLLVVMLSINFTNSVQSREILNGEHIDSNTTPIKTTSCPHGYLTGTHKNLCYADYLTPSVSADFVTDDQCPSLYVSVPGISSYCIMDNQNLHVSVEEKTVLISRLTQSGCISGFRKFKNAASLCLSNSTAVELVSDELTFISQINYFQHIDCDKSSSNICDSQNIFDPSANPAVFGCSFGFIYSPENDICTTIEMTESVDVTIYHLIPPTTCPSHWHRDYDSQLCRPKYKLHLCGKLYNCNQYDGDTLVISEKPLNCGKGQIKQIIKVPTKLAKSPATIEFDPFEPVLVINTFICAPPGRWIPPARN